MRGNEQPRSWAQLFPNTAKGTQNEKTNSVEAAPQLFLQRCTGGGKQGEFILGWFLYVKNLLYGKI